MDVPHAAGFDEELGRFAADLRRLRIEGGNPSYREPEARAAKSRIAGGCPSPPRATSAPTP
ncbi:hypothetical protein AB0953_11835 [Streptomyces sp. NPDC046866]|uniref:hypothetical protein n=1 Tax=Streptomyces sp. NPDC046866 TaxID=3154921 RepID=UPI003455BEEB